jgi:hypothetical protein
MAKQPDTNGVDRTKRSDLPLVRPGRVILGYLDRIEDASLVGWAVDSLVPDRTLTMRVLIDGQIADVISCDVNRPDTAPLNLPTTRVGFDYMIPLRFQDGLRHVLSFATLDGDPISLPTRGGLVLPELHFCLKTRIHIEGVLDGLVDGMIQGWVVRVDERSNSRMGGVRVLISTKGQPLAELTANEFRADVAEATGADPSCGFSYALPPELRTGKSIVLDFHAMPDRILLRGSPLELAIPAEAERARLSSLIDRADELFRYAYHLRRELKAAMPAERLTLGNYESWVRQSRKHVPARATARYGAIGGSPLVSILCPVFRPNQAEFLAAIDSVRAQTYPNWELILVDDASKDEALSETLDRMARVDPRIRLIVLPRNGGIAAATNKALEAATGEVTAFFDHDDVLEPGPGCSTRTKTRSTAAGASPSRTSSRISIIASCSTSITSATSSSPIPHCCARPAGSTPGSTGHRITTCCCGSPKSCWRTKSITSPKSCITGASPRNRPRAVPQRSPARRWPVRSRWPNISNGAICPPRSSGAAA